MMNREREVKDYESLGALGLGQNDTLTVIEVKESMIICKKCY